MHARTNIHPKRKSTEPTSSANATVAILPTVPTPAIQRESATMVPEVAECVAGPGLADSRVVEGACTALTLAGGAELLAADFFSCPWRCGL